MRCFIVASTFCLVFSSCFNNSTNDLIVFKTTNEGLQKSNQFISGQTELLYQALKDKTLNPQLHIRAEIWYPKALQVKQLSSTILKYIDKLKTDLKKEAGLKLENFAEVFQENNTNAVNSLFNEKKKGKELFERLEKYRADILNVDIELNRRFNRHMIITTKEFDALDSSKKEFSKYFFNKVPVAAAISILSHFENSIIIIENKLVSFCDNQGGFFIREFYESFKALIIQSSTKVKAGEAIEINAGIGAFSMAAQPEITIAGKTVATNEDGIAAYVIKAAAKPGEYIIPVKINFVKPDGTRDSGTFKIKYLVVD
jgi:gliding motility-associated protein GldM